MNRLDGIVEVVESQSLCTLKKDIHVLKRDYTSKKENLDKW